MPSVNVTLNPNDRFGFTLSSDKLTASSTDRANIRATDGKVVGKWYWEVIQKEGSLSTYFGIANKTFDILAGTQASKDTRSLYIINGYKLPENKVYSSATALRDVIGVALDLDNGVLEFYKNGVSMGVSHTDLTGMGEVFPFLRSTSVAGKSITFNFGAKPFVYPIPEGYLAYNIYPFSKCLIFNRNEFKKYSGSTWLSITTSTPTEADYFYGNTQEEVSAIPESAWQELTGPVELCYYTDDPAVTEVQFNIETEPFTLADEFAGESISIIEYTDNPNQTESTVTLETEPFTFYEEMGESFDVLYYTDDPDKTSAELEINANYTPLDEIDEDFEVVTWTNKEIEEVSEKLVTIPRTDVIEDGAIHSTIVDLTQGTGVTSVK